MTIAGTRAELQLLLHGAIVLLVGLLCGIPFGVAIMRAWGDEAVRAWRVAHSGGVTLGLLLLVSGLVLRRLLLSQRAIAALGVSLAASGYAFTLGMMIAATAGVRGLAPGGIVLNGIVFIAYIIGSVGALLGVALLIRGVCAALTKPSGS